MNKPKILAAIINKNCDQYLPNLFNELNKFDCDILLYNDRRKSNFAHENRHLPEVQEERLRNIGRARQDVLATFILGNDWTHLWWIDADFKTIPEGTLEKLLAFDVDVVTPILCLEDGTVYDATSTMKDGLFAKDLIERYPDTDLIEVTRANAPCLIKRKVFFSTDYLTKGNIQEGEYFSIMARRNGFKVYASLKTPIIHHTINGTMPLEKNGLPD